MQPENDDQEHVSEDDLIDEALGENTRARELRLFRNALESRQAGMQRELEKSTTDAERAAYAKKIADIKKQIETLRREEAISEFVEDSVRLTVMRSAIEEEY